MYNSQEIAFKIKQSAKNQKITIKQLLDKCGLNVNYISQFANGRDMTVGNLYSIADCLGVSVDYLLGRTDTPTGYSTSINNVQTAETISAEDAELLELIKKLPLKKRVKFISALYDELEGA